MLRTLSSVIRDEAAVYYRRPEECLEWQREDLGGRRHGPVQPEHTHTLHTHQEEHAAMQSTDVLET